MKQKRALDSESDVTENKKWKAYSDEVRKQVTIFCYDHLELVQQSDSIIGLPYSIIFEELVKCNNVQLPAPGIWNKELAHQLRSIFGNRAYKQSYRCRITRERIKPHWTLRFKTIVVDQSCYITSRKSLETFKHQSNENDRIQTFEMKEDNVDPCSLIDCEQSPSLEIPNHSQEIIVSNDSLTSVEIPASPSSLGHSSYAENPHDIIIMGDNFCTSDEIPSATVDQHRLLSNIDPLYSHSLLGSNYSNNNQSCDSMIIDNNFIVHSEETLDMHKQEHTVTSCAGVCLSESEIISCIFDKYGAAITSNKKCLGIAVTVNNEIVNYVSTDCTKTAGSPQSMRCLNCAKLRRKLKDSFRHAGDKRLFVVPNAAKSQIQFYKQELNRLRNRIKRMEEDTEEEVPSTKELNEDGQHLLHLLEETFAQERLTRNQFVYTFIESQLNALLCKDARAFRWDPDIIHWTTTVQYLGGTRLLEMMRGNALQSQGQHGSLPVKPDKWSLFLPSNSTLKSYRQYISAYPDPEDLEEQCRKISQMFEKKGKPKTGGLVFDEIEIRSGLIYLKRSGRLLGLVSGEVQEQNVQELLNPERDISLELGKYIMQVFFVSTDGSISIPLWYFLSHQTTGKYVFDRITPVVNALKQQGIEVTWTSSDGFASCKQFVKYMSSFSPNCVHIFDYVHIVKLLRNVLIDKMLHHGNWERSFCMRTLIDMYEDPKSARWKSTLKGHEDVFNPSDKMELDAVKRLLFIAPDLYAYANDKPEPEPFDPEKFWLPEQVQILQTQLSEPATSSADGIAKYLLAVLAYYMCWNDNNPSMSIKLKLLEAVNKYFKDWDAIPGAKTISRDCKFFIDTSINSLTKLNAGYERMYHTPIKSTSILGTNIVENFFSIIRQKVHYPNFWEYAYTYHRAYTELVKKFAVDRPYPLPQGPLSKNYNNQHGLQFTMADTNCSTSSRKRSKPSVQAPNDRQQQNIDLCIKLAQEHPCTRCRLTTREATCKDNPTARRTHGNIYCPYPLCARIFKYRKAVRTHLTKKHRILSKKRLDQLMSRAPIHLGTSVEEAEPDEETVSETSIVEDEEKDADEDMWTELQDVIEELAFEEETEPLEDSTIEDEIEGAAIPIIYDVETTGLGATRKIIQISAKAFESTKSFTSFVSPRNPDGTLCPVHSNAFAVNHITTNMVKDAPTWKVVGKRFIEWLKSFKYPVLLIAHNNSFDEKSLRSECNAFKQHLPKNVKFMCSLQLVKSILHRNRDNSLKELCEEYEVPLPNPLHRADADVQALCDFLSIFLQKHSDGNLTPTQVLNNFYSAQNNAQSSSSPSSSSTAQSTTLSTQKRKYKCGKCGMIKAGHTCIYQSK